jgi:CRP-like cAMP-binding protein
LSHAQVSRLLQSTPLLCDARQTDLDRLARSVIHEDVPTGHVVFQKNAVGDALFVVAEGRIMITSPGRGGKQFLLGIVDAGGLFGELALLEGCRRITNAVAECRSHLIKVHRRHIQSIVSRNRACALAFSRILSRHLRTTVEDLGTVGLNDAKTRLWLRLMSLSRRYGRVNCDTGRLRIEHGYSQQNLADSLGITRVMVNRHLASWQDQKLIEHGRGYVEILDPEKLEALVWSDD